MRDDLERFIRDHREELDVHEPPGDLWPAIDRQLRPARRKSNKAYYAVAATVLLLVGAFIWFMRHNAQTGVLPVSTEVAGSPEIMEAEMYYTSVVEQKMALLHHFGKEYPDMFRDFEGEIDTLHLIYDQLKAEYKNSNGSEAVSQALIENLQMQVQLLSTQLQMIQDIKEKEHKKHTTYKLM